MSQQTIIDPSHELKAAPTLPEIEHHDYPELGGYDGYLHALDMKLQAHGKLGE